MNQPRQKIQAGVISCAVWDNTIVANGRSVAVLKATVERRYRDASGQWKSTGSFSRADVPLVIWCLQKALDTMIQYDNATSEEVQEAPP